MKYDVQARHRAERFLTSVNLPVETFPLGRLAKFPNKPEALVYWLEASSLERGL